jgi:diaminohydroxyphosphoribosylaminopyrimidine deaminase/5-amino-6-(5-phosphoribosylamino)uracil reductase
MNEVDVKFMQEALRQARKGLGRTSPNPAVGAVIVRNGKAIATGYHRRAGLPHAEINALKEAGTKAAGATLYVTLEPCNHYGRTPPCTEAILRSGIKRVVIGMRDPNPDVTGGGCEFLRDKGIEVKPDVLEAECAQLNEVFLKFVTSRRPFVIVKSALTLDGWAATSTGNSKWVTNERSRQFVHRLRDRVDAVMVGVGTVLTDDPLLTTRLIRGRGRDPSRIVVDTHLRIPPNAKILHHDSYSNTLIAVGAGVQRKKMEKFRREGVSIITCPTKRNMIDLGALMDILGKNSVTSLLVEGGASLIGSMLRERLIDKFFIFKSSKILGGDDGIPMASGPGAKSMDQCAVLRDIRTKRFGDDLLIIGYPNYH